MNLGIRPIYERFLLPNYLFALEFREGFIFCRVIRRRIMQYKPYPLIDSSGNNIDIAASSHQAEVSLVDPRNPAKEILYLDTTTNSGFAWILHGAIGIKPYPGGTRCFPNSRLRRRTNRNGRYTSNGLEHNAYDDRRGY